LIVTLSAPAASLGEGAAPAEGQRHAGALGDLAQPPICIVTGVLLVQLVAPQVMPDLAPADVEDHELIGVPVEETLDCAVHNHAVLE